jgi:hypothetical protein
MPRASAVAFCSCALYVTGRQGGLYKVTYGGVSGGATLVATQGDITVAANAVVDLFSSCNCPLIPRFFAGGDLQAGGSILLDPDAQVSGALRPDTPTDPTPVAPPAGLVSQGDLTVPALTTMELPAGDYLFDDVVVESNGILRGIDGPVKVFFDGLLQVGSNGVVESESSRPSDFTLLSRPASSSVELISNARVVADLLTPNVPVSVGSNVELFGSVVGLSLTLETNARAHLDGASCEGCPPPTPIAAGLPALAGAIESTAAGVIVGPGAVVDSYSSCDGPYGGANVGSNGHVQAAGTITNDGTVLGDLHPSTPSGASAVTPPDGLASAGDLVLGPGDSLVLPAGDYRYDDVFLDSGAHVEGSGGAVRLWFDGSLTLASGAELVGADGLPENLWLFGRCNPGSVTLGNSTAGNLVGVLYAPDIDVHLLPNARLFGAVVGAEVTVGDNAELHHDAALVDGCN